ncbi:MAG: AraC family transcriptional regulator, partial [Leptospirales bacterium]
VDEGEGILVDPAAGPRILAGLSALGASEDCGDTSSFCPERLLGELLGSTRPAYERSEVDARLIRVIEILLADPAAAPEVASLAAAIDMSSSWLQHNFRAQLGVPIRRFRTFFRLKAAALFMRRGSTLVDAALAAGFYDQPHFSNAFREMFGIQPGLIFLQDGEIRWYIDDELFVSDLVGRGLFHLA